MKKIRDNGVRTKRDGTITKQVSFDLPSEMVENLKKVSKKTGISKNFLVAKALKLLLLQQEE